MRARWEQLRSGIPLPARIGMPECLCAPMRQHIHTHPCIPAWQKLVDEHTIGTRWWLLWGLALVVAAVSQGFRKAPVLVLDYAGCSREQR